MSELGGTGFGGPVGNFCPKATGSQPSTPGGATGWLSSQAPVKPGEVITLQFFIWDTGDQNFDSSVLLDHLTWQPGPTQTTTTRPPPVK